MKRVYSAAWRRIKEAIYKKSHAKTAERSMNKAAMVYSSNPRYG